MNNPPPSVTDSWPAPNYDNPELRSGALTAVDSSVCAIVLIVVFARCYTRLRITGSFGLDDVFICLALIPSLGLTGCTLASERVYGWNRHVWDATHEQIRGGLIMEFASGILYIVSSMLTKLSVVFFCRRLVCESHPAWYRKALNCFAVLTFVGNMAYVITFCLSCQPLSAYWDNFPHEPDYPYHCIDLGQLWLSGSILNVTWDFLTWLVPLPVVLKLHLPMRQRIAVLALFAMGLAVVAAGIMKTIYVQIAFNETYDVTWIGYPSWICGALEIDTGILCASIPALRPLFSHFCPRPERWIMRKSYSRMSKGKDSLGDGTPLSPLSPAHLNIETTQVKDDLKPWSRRSARSSIYKMELSPISPVSPMGMTSNNDSRRLTPLTEIVSAADRGDSDWTPALSPSEIGALQHGLGEPDKVYHPRSPVKPFSFNQPRMLPRLDTASIRSKRTVDAESPVSRKGHSRKSSSKVDLESFNFNLPATSSRRDSQATAPPSYGDFVNQNSFIISEDNPDANPEKVHDQADHAG